MCNNIEPPRSILTWGLLVPRLFNVEACAVLAPQHWRGASRNKNPNMNHPIHQFNFDRAWLQVCRGCMNKPGVRTVTRLSISRAAASQHGDACCLCIVSNRGQRWPPTEKYPTCYMNVSLSKAKTSFLSWVIVRVIVVFKKKNVFSFLRSTITRAITQL